jgi:glycosyltransferase involved in cell wall biosynthesis
VGGGELLAVRLSAEIIRQRPCDKVFLISLYDAIPSIVYDEALESGATILPLCKKKGFDPLMPFKINSALRSIKPDVIHTHLAGLRYALYGAIFCNDSIRIHTVHNMATHEASRYMQPTHGFAFKHLGWIPVALSKQVQKSIHDVYGLDAPIVYNGIKVKESILKQNKRDLRKAYKLPIHGFLIITIGRLSVQKNQALIIDAFKHLSQINSGCSLIIVGQDDTDGSQRRMLESKAGSLPEKIRDNIHFLGLRKDIPELLMASDVFVLSSDWEGVPLTLLEAMGYNVPVICTSVGGIPDIIEHGITGCLVPKNDSIGLANAMLNVMINNSYATKLSANAREKFKELFSIEMTTKGYLELYKRYLTVHRWSNFK